MSTSTYFSAAEEISNLRIHSIPSKPIKDARAIRVDRTYVIVDAKGKVYSSQVTGNYAYTPGHNSNSLRNTIEGAHRLGVISKEAMDKDRAHRNAIALADELKQQAKVLRIAAHNLGIKLTAAQLRKADATAVAAAAKKGGAQ